MEMEKRIDKGSPGQYYNYGYITQIIQQKGSSAYAAEN